MDTKIIKIFLALLFFICLADMPYGFYQFVRFTGLIGFLYLGVNSLQLNKDTIAVGWVDLQLKYGNTVRYFVLAILFQPLIKISLDRQLWNIIDVIVGVGLLISIFIKPKES